MTTYIISDTHFGHKKMILERGYKNVDEMNNDLIEYWNDIVTDKDEVIHLGDVALDMNLEDIEEKILKKLKGKKTLIIGNHDTCTKIPLYTKYFKCYSVLRIKNNIFSHIPINNLAIGLNENNYHGHFHHIVNLGSSQYINCAWDVVKKFIIL